MVGGNRSLGEREQGKKCPLGFLLYLSLSTLDLSQSVSQKQRPDSGRYREGTDRDKKASHSFFISIQMQSKFFCSGCKQGRSEDCNSSSNPPRVPSTRSPRRRPVWAPLPQLRLIQPLLPGYLICGSHQRLRQCILYLTRITRVLPVRPVPQPSAS